jgi:hypothetical protein
MLRVCPKCGDYYADAQLAFCFADGAPLISVDPSSDKWSEGSRTIEEKARAIKKSRRRLRWKRVLASAVTLLIATMILSRSYTVETTPAPLHKISGRVIDASEPVVGININLEGAKTASATTDSKGNYSFSDLPSGPYTVTPVLNARTNFTPPSHTFENLTQDGSADFSRVVQITVHQNVYKISGRVTDGKGAVSGVKINLGGAKTSSAATDANGNYSFTGLQAGGSYTITPVPSDRMDFKPRGHPIDNLTHDETANFAGNVHPDVYRISGRVMDARGPMPGINLRLTGGKVESTTTDPRGNYTFNGLAAGNNYTVTPVSAAITFTPTKFYVGKLTQDASANFNGVPKRDLNADCTDADKKIDAKAIGEVMRRIILADPHSVIKNPRDLVETSAASPRIESIVLFEKCTIARITVSFPHRVEGLNGRPNIDTDRTTRTFSCHKQNGAWQCP